MKGIMFSDELIPMVLDGSKTMTRRIMKVQPGEVWPSCDHGYQDEHGKQLKPRYNIGETIYLKEAWAKFGDTDLAYRAAMTREEAEGWIWRNKLYMPEWASRAKLEITGVGAEWLQEISERDLKKELDWSNYKIPDGDDPWGVFASVIDCINGPGTWERNPGVWVYEFRRVV